MLVVQVDDPASGIARRNDNLTREPLAADPSTRRNRSE